MLDLSTIRRDTPGCQNVIHLHNSGAALMPIQVANAVKAHIDAECAVGGYEAAVNAEADIANTYDAAARMLGCQSSEIALVESATVAWNRCFLALTQSCAPGDRILTGRTEYASNYIAMLQLAARAGVQIDVVPDDATGSLDVRALENMIDDRVKAVCITHVPTSGSVVSPAAAIGEVTRRHAIPFLLDACQSAGQMPLDVKTIGCDALSATGRKFLRGPRGTGLLYISESLAARLEPPDLDLHGAIWSARDAYQPYAGAQRFEYFEGSVASKIGLGVALQYALNLGLEAIWSRIQYLADGLRERLRGLDQYTLLDTGRERCAIVTFAHRTLAPAEVAGRLRARGINVGTSDMRSTRLDLEGRADAGLVRAPVHYYNTDDELDRLIEVLGTFD
ncbi:MAG: aminotransferase class V-fold PLP-dependent enzyme [Gammaproteobacteria bacterium]|nr:aminotransferase class V-fold PLP-dependent enzyme [Gammaproteobacteria bacterium]